MIKITCKNCGKRLAVEDQYAGRRVRCKRCGQPVPVQQESTLSSDGVLFPTSADASNPAAEPSDMSKADRIKVVCWECGKRLAVKKQYAGRSVRCTRCASAVRVPGLPESEWPRPQPAKAQPAANPASQAVPSTQPSPKVIPHASTTWTPPAPKPVPIAPAVKPSRAKPQPTSAVNREEDESVARRSRPGIAMNAQGMLMLAAGAVAALVGGSLWALAVRSTGYQFGFAAWALGLWVGVAVILAGRTRGSTVAAVAVVMVLLSLAVGKWMIVEFSMPALATKNVTFNQQQLGAAVWWCMDQDKDFSPELNARLKNLGLGEELTRAQEEEMRQQVLQRLASLSESGKQQVMQRYLAGQVSDWSPWFKWKNALSPFDALWTALALLTAFFLGRGGLSASNGSRL